MFTCYQFNFFQPPDVALCALVLQVVASYLSFYQTSNNYLAFSHDSCDLIFVTLVSRAAVVVVRLQFRVSSARRQYDIHRHRPRKLANVLRRSHCSQSWTAAVTDVLYQATFYIEICDSSIRYRTVHCRQGGYIRWTSSQKKAYKLLQLLISY